MSKKAGWISASVITSLIAGGAVYASTSKSDTSGEVLRIIDGDTVDMRIAGEDTRVRLLNIDTPESVDPNKSIECLGPEATEYLHTLLSPGDKVDLEYDIERIDKYGRTLAAVYKDGTFINRQIAAEGMGIAVKYEPNTRFYPEILAAQESANEAQSGLFDSEISCTIPSQLAQTDAVIESVPIEPAEDLTEADSLLGEAAAAVAFGVGVKERLKSFTPDSHPVSHALATDFLYSSVNKIDSKIADAEAKQKIHKDAKNRLVKADKQRKAAEKKKKEEARKKAEAKKKAQEQKAAAERAAAKKRAAQYQAPRTSTSHKLRKPPTRSYVQPKPRPRYSAPRKAPSSKYTGPRCYAPGGKTWKPCP